MSAADHWPIAWDVRDGKAVRRLPDPTRSVLIEYISGAAAVSVALSAREASRLYRELGDAIRGDAPEGTDDVDG